MKDLHTIVDKQLVADSNTRSYKWYKPKNWSYAMLLSVSFLFAGLYTMHAQQKTITTLEKNYSDHFKLSRESVYIHPNKTTYIVGEEIWFTGYVYDKALSKPALRTTNVHCGIYNSEGLEIAKEVFYTENGYTKGSFKIRNHWSPGNYFIKAETNWMKNFKEDTPFVQQITILGNSNASTETIQNEVYDLQILPEGGYLIANSFNSIGYKVSTQNGQAIAIKSGEIVDNEGIVVSNTINESWQGMGKFQINIATHKTYTLKCTLLNGDIISKTLPKSKKEGIALFVNNVPKDIIAIQFNTNPNTIANLQGQELYLAIHRDGLLVVKKIAVTDLNKIVRIGKDKLLPGINILTLFNADLQPICERLIFNHAKSPLGVAKATLIKKSTLKDSIKLQLELSSKAQGISNLSLSVLPEESIANRTHKTIQTSFLLEPYLKNQIPNTAYYFSNSSRKKQFELDLMLLVQGWSRYDWEHIFKKNAPPSYDFENGFTIRGKIMNAPFGESSQISILQQKSKNILVADLDVKKNFLIENALLYSNDSLSISLLDSKGKMRLPEFEIDITPKQKPEILSPTYLRIFTHESRSTERSLKNTNALVAFEDTDAIALDNVVVTETKTSNKLSRNESLKVGAYEARKIAITDLKKSKLLSQFVRSLGFKVSKNGAANTIFISAKLPLTPPPIVYLDGFKLQAPLRDTPLQFIDEVYYEHLGLEGSGGGTLYIYRKSDGYVGEKQIQRFASKFMEEGYHQPKEYFNPKYSSNSSQDYLAYGVVDWKPNIQISTSGKIELLVPNYGLYRIRLYIEGMSTDGILYSETQNITIN